jgi:hypothetical protein
MQMTLIDARVGVLPTGRRRAGQAMATGTSNGRDARRTAVQLLLRFADVEESLAESFQLLAASGGPAYRKRRTELAHAAMAMAAEVRLQVEACRNRHPHWYE